MFGAFILVVVLYLINQPLLGYFKNQYNFLRIKLLNQLYWYHMLFAVIYYIYSIFNPSDSQRYFNRNSIDGNLSISYPPYQTGTGFIDFIVYPFVHELGFSYEMAMILFAWFGYLGFVFFYIFFRENIKETIRVYSFDLVTILLFLPNMHFWTASLGKGSFIFLGIAMFAYALKAPQKRIVSMVLAFIIVYSVRPHMMMFLAVGAVVGYLTGRENIPLYQKLIILGACVAGIFLMYDKILEMASINEEDVVGSFQNFSSNRAELLARSGSGVDMSNYPLLLKLFTFWFRPLFFDAPGALGLYISAENLLYLLLTLKLIDKSFMKFLKGASSLVKMSLITFISSSVALSFVMSNLGIVIRQKSMVMYFLFFVILAFLEFKKRQKNDTDLIVSTNNQISRQQLRLV
ncbi:hypothetical protein [uncultured Pontibacter sp.]|uniref:hypothetical protein n=1 Tax=uncultured Pontibacter sp. TaxID=453356 RepID=UPI00260C6D54|nr:hypothetical protein [uncultured Pontibacter sp.]